MAPDRDGPDSFFASPSSVYSLEAHRWLRYEREPIQIRRTTWLILLASLVVLILIAAEVSAATALPLRLLIPQA